MGAVAVGERYVGIYPQNSPGGWQIIGLSPVSIFDRNRNPNFLLEPGDTIQWKEVDARTYKKLNAKPRYIPNFQDEKSYCKVIESGFYTSIQDCGRQGWRSKGVPLSGPMDRASFNRANRIVGNVPGLASLEITLSGPTLLFNDPVWVAASGAPLSLFHNDKEQRMGFPFLCDLGDILRIGKIEKGARAYLSFLGGLQCRKYLGSASQFAPITPNGRLEKGDQLSFVSSLSFPNPLLAKNQQEADSLEERKFLRVRPGIDWDKCPQNNKVN